MKTFLVCLHVLTFTLVCPAQSERWQLSIPLSADVIHSPVYPDGGGGGAILLGPFGGLTLSRVVWFNAAGAILADTNFQPATVAVLRVTSKALDVHVTETPQPFLLPEVTLHRFTSKPGAAKITPLLETVGNLSNERVATTVTPQADKRGFFTVQLNNTNVLVRRYTF